MKDTRTLDKSTVAFAGIDTHKDTHTVALTDALGRSLGSWQVAANDAGFREVAKLLGSTRTVVGIEGCESYGRALCEFLTTLGFGVYEVMRPKRTPQRNGKSDAIDALAAALCVQQGKGIPIKVHTDKIDELHCLINLRDNLVKQMTQTSNCIKAILLRSTNIKLRELASLSSLKQMKYLAAMDNKDSQSRALCTQAKRWLQDQIEIDTLEKEMATIVEELYPLLLSAQGIGVIGAAKITCAVKANPFSIKSEAAFSLMCGTSPLPACSGKTNRHRLNRGGNRTLNNVIHTIAINRKQNDERTKAYLEKKTREGKSTKEALRALKRFIAREIYRLLTSDQTQAIKVEELKELRLRLHLTQQQIEQFAGLPVRSVGRLECKQQFNTNQLKIYQATLMALKSQINC